MGERKIAFPPHLLAHVDTLVRNAHAGVREPAGPAFDLVTSWCEIHPDESHIESGEAGRAFVVVPVDTLPSGCSDDEVELSEGLPPTAITDAMRVAVLRERLEEILDGASEESLDYPMACFLRIRASNGESAILGYLWSGGGDGATPEVEWVGAYRTATEWKADLRKRGQITGAADVNRLSDSDLLKMWKRANTSRE